VVPGQVALARMSQCLPDLAVLTIAQRTADGLRAAPLESILPRVSFELIELPEEFERLRLLELFRMADDSEEAIAEYMHEGRLFGLWGEGSIVGHVLVLERGVGDEVELRSLAIFPAMRRRGLGRAMLTRLLAALAGEGVRRVWVATASADVRNIAFYQKLGFRMHSIERDAFTVERGYPAGLTVGGIAVRDRVWFDRELK
jgi:N-acetylglutamate synthase-like GNAT family acetyltransferase